MIGWLARHLCPRRNVSTYRKIFTQKSSSDLEVLLSQLTGGNLDNIEAFATKFNSLQFNPITTASCTKIGYLPIAEVDNVYNLCMFYLPPGSLLPYHNHPDQHVLLRVVSGSLEINSFDIEVEDGSKVEPGKIYKIRDDSRISQILTVDDSTQIVRPKKSNIHEIKAHGSDGAMFVDLVVPPYYWDRSIVYFEETGTGTVRGLRERDVALDMEQVYPEQFFRLK